METWIRRIRDFGVLNIVFILLISYLLAQRLPQMWQMYQNQGTAAPIASFQNLQGDIRNLPSPGQRQVVVFWATWCGPCKIELSRLDAMIAKGSVRPEQVLAISSGESVDLVRQEVQERGYHFSVGIDERGQAAMAYQVSGTPTVLLIDEKGLVQWVTMGLSPSLEFRVSQFLATDGKETP